MYPRQMFSSTGVKDDLHWWITIFISLFSKVVSEHDMIRIEFLETKQGKIFNVSQSGEMVNDTVICKSSMRSTKHLILALYCNTYCNYNTTILQYSR